jgi:CBS domain-containing protein
VTEITERAVVSRVPGLIDEKLKVLARREPLMVRPGTSLADCLALIRETGVADSVFVTDAGGRLLGVLTERDIFARLVVPDADLGQPVEALLVVRPVDVLKYLAEAFPEELLNLPPRPHQLMDATEGA